LLSLKQQLQQKLPFEDYDSTKLYFDIYTKKGLHYLKPTYQLLLNSNKLKAAIGRHGFYDNASQWLSFSGDYLTSNALAETDVDTLTKQSKKDIERLINSTYGLQHEDAKKYIIKKALDYRIVMINEAHHNPSHRAFTFSLLADLYSQGYHYFAMETFNNYQSQTLDKVTSLTGTYTSEPTGGELVRHALQIGYKLIPYEDTVYKPGRTGTQRDSAQAKHIYEALQKDTAAKILIHAGYGHIAKEVIGDYVPLGKALRNLMGVPSFSIDQTTFSEGNQYSFEKEKYNRYLQRYVISKPSVVVRTKTTSKLFDTSLYNLYVIHPKTIFKDGRPNWVSLNGYRKRHVVSKNLMSPLTFFVQAYYRQEIENNKLQNSIPADQTYNKTKSGDIVLYLRKGEYALVFRDAYYQIVKQSRLSIK